MNDIERQYKPIGAKGKLTILWSIYTLIVGGLAWFALWTGDWRWNAEVMIFSWPLLFIAPTLVATSLFRKISKVIKGEAEWGDAGAKGVRPGASFDHGVEAINLDNMYKGKPWI